MYHPRLLYDAARIVIGTTHRAEQNSHFSAPQEPLTWAYTGGARPGAFVVAEFYVIDIFKPVW